MGIVSFCTAADKHLHFASFSSCFKYFPCVLVTQNVLCTYVFLNLMQRPPVLFIGHIAPALTFTFFLISSVPGEKLCFYESANRSRN